MLHACDVIIQSEEANHEGQNYLLCYNYGSISLIGVQITVNY